MKTKDVLSACALASAIVIAFLGILIEPLGIIDTSLLYVIAQLLIYSASLLGISSAIQQFTKTFKNNATSCNNA